MHIQEGTTTTLTTCTKMTEEVDRLHGLNGNSSGVKTEVEDVATNNSTHSSGGSLKFFKDGKFILELVRGCPREGERPSWVSVPRKTFWPPAGPPVHTLLPPRPERTASCSVSDDNSSIQSSPWQRDHCWKQNTPRRNISKELTFSYCRPSTLLNSTIDPASKLKRRRPNDTSQLDVVVNGVKKHLTNGVSDKKKNGEASSPGGSGRDVVDGPASVSTERPRTANDDRTDYDRGKYLHMKLKKPYQYHTFRVYKKTKPSISAKKLNDTIDRLREKTAALPAPVNVKIVNCKREEHAIVSPRKRILRELERVSLEEGAKRRVVPPPGPSPRPAPTQKLSDYSISALLDERRGGGGGGSAPMVQRPEPMMLSSAYTSLMYRSPHPPPPPLWVQFAPPGWLPPPQHLAPPPPRAPLAQRASPSAFAAHVSPRAPRPHLHPHPSLLAMHSHEHNNDLPLNLSKH